MGADRVLFVCDEVEPVASAPAVRLRALAEPFGPEVAEILGGYCGELQHSAFRRTLIRRPAEREPVRFAWFLLKLEARLLRLAMRRRYEAIVVSVPKYELLMVFPWLRRWARLLVLDLRDSPEFLDYGAYLRHFLPASLARFLGAVVVRLSRFLLLRSVHAADLVIVANDAIGRSIPSNGGWIQTIENGVDFRWVREGGGVARQRSAEPLRMVYVGNYAEKDDFEFLADGLCRCTGEWLLDLYGSGRNKERALGVLRDAGVSFSDHGSVLHDELAERLAGAHVGCLFRRSGDESLPVSVLELAAIGIPAICNDAGLLADTVRDEDLGYVVSTPAELTALIDRLASQPSELRRFDSLGERAARRFSREAQARRFYETVTGLLRQLERG